MTGSACDRRCWRADGLTVYVSTQFTADIRKKLAEVFVLPLGHVRVIVEATGVGIASKSSVGNDAPTILRVAGLV